MTVVENEAIDTLEASMMALPSRLGLASRKAGSDSAALERR